MVSVGSTAASVIPSGGTTGALLTKTASDSAWLNAGTLSYAPQYTSGGWFDNRVNNTRTNLAYSIAGIGTVYVPIYVNQTVSIQKLGVIVSGNTNSVPLLLGISAIGSSGTPGAVLVSASADPTSGIAPISATLTAGWYFFYCGCLSSATGITILSMGASAFRNVLGSVSVNSGSPTLAWTGPNPVTGNPGPNPTVTPVTNTNVPVLSFQVA